MHDSIVAACPHRLTPARACQELWQDIHVIVLSGRSARAVEAAVLDWLLMLCGLLAFASHARPKRTLLL